MSRHMLYQGLISLACISLLSACASIQTPLATTSSSDPYAKYVNNVPMPPVPKMPEKMETGGKKMVLVDPNLHGWGAYDANGNLVRSGLATAGGIVCPPDEDAATCKTGIGKFRIQSLGDFSCASRIYPKPEGGGLMPYCMFFNGGQALHGAPDQLVVAANVSHGCVRMRIPDAEWMRNNFAEVGTRVVVLPYSS